MVRTEPYCRRLFAQCGIADASFLFLTVNAEAGHNTSSVAQDGMWNIVLTTKPSVLRFELVHTRP
ncbi:MAG: hypothetical protein IH899_15900 [Planctomycetes bacterium]|nr:hypothetical protein [Planctomycetota bacterium]